MDEYDNDNHDADENDDMSQEDASETAADNGNSRLAGEWNNNSISHYNNSFCLLLVQFHHLILKPFEKESIVR